MWRNNLEEIAAGRMKDLLVLFDVVNTISQSLELGTVLPKVLELVTDTMGADKGAIVLVGGDGRSLDLIAHRGLSDESIREITQTGMGGIGDVLLRNKTILIGAGSEEGPHVVPGLDKDNIVSAMVAPISARGTMYGALAVYSDNAEQFADQDETLLATIGNQVSGAVLNARLYKKTLELAQLDGLTGLANQRYLMERLGQEMSRAERYQTSLSAIMLDLDKFKSFNDTYGHLKGDELLRSFSALLKGTVRTSDIAGRYGGEEFCVMLPNTSIKGALVIAERIRKAAEELKVPVDDHQPPAGRTVSIGVSEFTPGDSIEKLISTADAALYRAKEGGRNRVVS
jgi:diguanylate cyclase (GGDEF)-like protein